MGEDGMTAVDAMALLFNRQLDPHQTTFALGEALAHLHYLWFAGEWQRQKDANGVFSFAPIEAVVHP